MCFWHRACKEIIKYCPEWKSIAVHFAWFFSRRLKRERQGEWEGKGASIIPFIATSNGAIVSVRIVLKLFSNYFPVICYSLLICACKNGKRNEFDALHDKQCVMYLRGFEKYSYDLWYELAMSSNIFSFYCPACNASITHVSSDLIDALCHSCPKIFHPICIHFMKKEALLVQFILLLAPCLRG